MNHKGIFGISACAALALAVPFGAFAQQKSLKEQIIGTWSITAVSDQYEDGTKVATFGTGVKGVFNFDGSGHFDWIIIGEKQESMKNPDPRKPDAYTIALIGTYSIDGNVIKMRADRAANSVRDGADSTFTVTGTGDALVLAGSARPDQKGTFKPTLDIARAK